MLPAGLGSEAKFKDAKLYVQTEFAQRPRPRVTTTIFLNGEVVEKVENIWEKLPQTEEEKQKIEKFVREQHRQVLEKIKKRGEKFTSLKQSQKKEAPAEEDMGAKICEELSKADGVLEWVVISKEDKTVASQTSSPKAEEIQDITRQIKDFALFLPSVTNLGRFVGGILDWPKMRLLFFFLQKRFLAIKLDQKVDPKNLVKRLKSLA